MYACMYLDMYICTYQRIYVCMDGRMEGPEERMDGCMHA